MNIGISMVKVEVCTHLCVELVRSGGEEGVTCARHVLGGRHVDRGQLVT